MSEKRRIVTNTLANGASQVTAMLSALIFMPLLIRNFGQAEYGLFLLASSIAAYASLVDFGVGTSLLKNIAEHTASGNKEKLAKHISTSLAFYIGAGLLVAIALVAISLFTGSLFRVTVDGARLLRNLLLVVAIASVWTWPAGMGGLVLGGLQRYTLSARTALFAAVANVGVVLVVLTLHEGPLTLLIGQSLVGAAAGATNLFLARRELGGLRIRPADADFGVFKEIVSFSWVIFVLQACTMVIYQQTDRVVIGVFVGASAITLYEAAGKMQVLVTQLVQFATSAVMPFASQLESEGRRSSLQTLFFRGTKYLMALVLPSVVALMVLAKPIITAWLGPDFAHMALSAQILLSYQLLWVGPVIGEHILTAQGQAKRRLFNSIFVVTLGNLVLSIVLVQRLGVLGVVIGTAVPWVVDFPSRMHVILSGVGVSFWGWLRHSAGPVYLSLTATLAVAAAGYLTPLVQSLPGLLLLAALSVMASWGSLLLLALTPVEKAELRGLVHQMQSRFANRR